FRDLPRRFQVNNPNAWGDAAITSWVDSEETMVEGRTVHWGYYRGFCHRAEDPEWSGWVCTKNKSRSLLKESDPLDLLSSPSLAIRKAELNQRTGPGRYKKVMWYRPGVG